MIISFICGKGGVGKTTLAVNTAAFLAKNKKAKVLLLDLDKQCNLSLSFGKLSHESTTSSILTLLLKPTTPPSQIIRNINLDILDTKFKGTLDLIPAEDSLDQYDSYIINKKFTSDALAKLIQKLNLFYDYIIIDTSPWLNSLTKTVWRISNKIVIPFEPKLYGWNGVVKLLEFMDKDQFFNSKTTSLTQIYAVANRMAKRSIYDNSYYLETAKSIATFNQTKNKSAIIPQLLTTKIYSSTNFSKSLARELLPLYLTKTTSKVLEPTITIFNSFIKELGL